MAIWANKNDARRITKGIGGFWNFWARWKLQRQLRRGIRQVEGVCLPGPRGDLADPQADLSSRRLTR